MREATSGGVASFFLSGASDVPTLTEMTFVGFVELADAFFDKFPNMNKGARLGPVPEFPRARVLADPAFAAHGRLMRLMERRTITSARTIKPTVIRNGALIRKEVLITQGNNTR